MTRGFRSSVAQKTGWSNEDIYTYLKYYADEKERQQAAADGYVLPDHVDPPYSRGHVLP